METDRQQLLGKKKLQLLHLGSEENQGGGGGTYSPFFLDAEATVCPQLSGSQDCHSCQLTKSVRVNPNLLPLGQHPPQDTGCLLFSFWTNRPSSTEAWDPERVSETPPQRDHVLSCESQCVSHQRPIWPSFLSLSI